jgi:hypothetical protein
MDADESDGKASGTDGIDATGVGVDVIEEAGLFRIPKIGELIVIFFIRSNTTNEIKRKHKL